MKSIQINRNSWIIKFMAFVELKKWTELRFNNWYKWEVCGTYDSCELTTRLFFNVVKTLFGLFLAGVAAPIVAAGLYTLIFYVFYLFQFPAAPTDIFEFIAMVWFILIGCALLMIAVSGVYCGITYIKDTVFYRRPSSGRLGEFTSHVSNLYYGLKEKYCSKLEFVDESKDLYDPQ